MVCMVVLFSDTWSQSGRLLSCMTILFLNLQITRSDVRPYIKWAVSLVIAYGHYNLPQGFFVGMYGLTYHFNNLEGHKQVKQMKMQKTKHVKIVIIRHSINGYLLFLQTNLSCIVCCIPYIYDSLTVFCLWHCFPSHQQVAYLYIYVF